MLQVPTHGMINVVAAPHLAVASTYAALYRNPVQQAAAGIQVGTAPPLCRPGALPATLQHAALHDCMNSMPRCIPRLRLAACVLGCARKACAEVCPKLHSICCVPLPGST